jgi:hypothetical protein
MSESSCGLFCGHEGRQCFRRDGACLNAGKCLGISVMTESARDDGMKEVDRLLQIIREIESGKVGPEEAAHLLQEIEASKDKIRAITNVQ